MFAAVGHHGRRELTIILMVKTSTDSYPSTEHL
ncbi:hypothetical protein EDD73_101191, partial [Heliophilum fasciatum]